MTMTEYDKQAAAALLSSLYLSYERVLRAERELHQRHGKTSYKRLKTIF